MRLSHLRIRNFRSCRDVTLEIGGVPGPDAFAPDSATQLYGYSDSLIAFGEFTFDMNKQDPEVTFRLINEEEQVLEKHTFFCSQLTPHKEKKQ